MNLRRNEDYRIECSLDAKIKINNQLQPVIINNLSFSGGRLKCKTNINIGEIIDLIMYINNQPIYTICVCMNLSNQLLGFQFHILTEKSSQILKDFIQNEYQRKEI